MIDLKKTSRKLMTGCLICLAIFSLIFAAMYKVLHVKLNHDHDSHLIITNEELPKFSLPILTDLQVIVNQSILKDRVTLINVWSNNCRSCRQEHLVLLKIAKYLKNKSINFIGLDNCDDQERAMTWLSIHGNPYTIHLFDQKGKLAMDLGVKGLPELFIIDSNKKIRYRYSGLITPIAWEQEIRPALDQLYLRTNK